MKLQDGEERLACDFISYVDYVRSGGKERLKARAASRRVASILNWLGSARKRSDPSQTPGPWAGSVVSLHEGVITISVTQDRWDKAKKIILWLQEVMASSEGIKHKTLEHHQGFLVYLVRTYPMLNPYLKGIHLTLDSWRPYQGTDRWKLTSRELQQALMEKEDNPWVIEMEDFAAPKFVKPVPRLQGDVEGVAFSSPQNDLQSEL